LRNRDIGIETLSENVYESLRKEISNLEIKPGTILTENDISVKYNISRSPVRSVFQKVKDDGLITAIPYKLSYVSQLDMNRIMEVIYMRIAVESAIMRDFILLDDKKSLRKMERNLEDQLDLLSEKVEFEDFEKLDSQFHKIMYQALGKMEVWNIIQKAELSYTRFKLLDLVAVGKFNEIYDDHATFLDIIKNKRIDEIEIAYKKHLYSGIHRLRDVVFTDYLDYFTEETNEECIKQIDKVLVSVYGSISG